MADNHSKMRSRACSDGGAGSETLFWFLFPFLYRSCTVFVPFFDPASARKFVGGRSEIRRRGEAHEEFKGVTLRNLKRR